MLAWRFPRKIGPRQSLAALTGARKGVRALPESIAGREFLGEAFNPSSAAFPAALPPEQARGGDRDALTALAQLVHEDLQACNQTIVQRMQSPVELIPRLAAHIVAAGGKRLRPLLTIACARLCGYPEKAENRGDGLRHVRLAAAVEFIHTATLLHDDVVDESKLRRGLASANAVFGNQASVLVGDFLFARAFELMVEDGSLTVLQILARAAATIAEGEVLQLMTQNDLTTSEQRYLNVISGKTAALFAAACEVGAVVAGESAEAQAALRRLGFNLGIAFQLTDDALDYVADQQRLGKTVGDDFREGKVTLPVLIAYAAGSAEERRFWQRTIAESDQCEEDLARALGLMERHGAIAATLARARDYAAKAKAGLALFREGRLREALADAIDYAVNRSR
jgi:octaprenyl-diphosphate synthase